MSVNTGSNSLLNALGCCIIIAYGMVDMVRHYFHGSPYLLLVIDILVFLLAMSALAAFKMRQRYNKGSQAYGFVAVLKFVVDNILRAVPWYVFWAGIIFYGYVLARFVAAGVFDVPAIAALRTYFLPIIMLIPGVYCGSRGLRIPHRTFVVTLCVLLAGEILFAMGQYVYLSRNVSKHYDRKWGNPIYPAFSNDKTYGDIKIYLLSGMFASEKRYARFLCLGGLMLLGWILTCRRYKKMGYLVVFLLLWFGIFISGARESIFIFSIGSLLIFMTYHFRSRRIWITASVFFLLVLTAFITTVEIGDKPPMITTDKSHHSRISAVMTTPSHILSRMYIAVPALFIREKASHVFFGKGPGTFGQEARMREGGSLAMEQLLRDTFSASPAGPVCLFGDAGLSRVIIELGTAGCILLLILWVVILLHLSIIFFDVLESGNAVTISGIIVLGAVLVYFLKAHTTFNDMAVMGFAWFIYGWLSALYVYGREISSVDKG